MSWFAVLITLAIAADVFAGVANPIRSFAILPVLMLAVVTWVALAWRRELRAALRRRAQ